MRFLAIPVAALAVLGLAAQDTPKKAPEVVPVEKLFTLPAATPGGEKLTASEIQAFLADPKNHDPVLPQPPLGLPDLAPFVPANNPMTRAKIELGRQLYFDTRLSRDNTVACVSCHDPAKGWSNHAPVATGINGQKGGRKSPTVLNRAYGKTQFWDGRAASLEEQALGPIQNPIEMGFTLDEAVERLRGIEGYRIQFEKVFGKVSADGVAKAIASFERTVLVGGSPHDYHEQFRPYEKLTADDLADDKELAARVEKARKEMAANPMSAAAKRGRDLYFGKASCSLCHVGANLTDEDFYNLGVGTQATSPDKGRVAISKNAKDTAAFKTPGLRNVTQTAPYLHDGSHKTLAEVVEFYDQGGRANPQLHERMKKLNLTKEEKADLVAYLEALTGPLPKIPAPRLP